jgi:PPOX class probable F420-dependent enzyme
VILDERECWARVEHARHGVLGTVHDGRGVDAVPVVFAVVDGLIVVPIDTVKPKRSTRLTRVANLARDPRCVLLVEHYADDWSQLWWVRIHALGSVLAPEAAWLDALAVRYPPYRSPGAIMAMLVLRSTVVTGWAAARS